MTKPTARPIRDNTIAAVLGGVILAGLLKISGFAPQLWNGIAAAVRWTLKSLVGRVSLTLPVWTWAIAWFVALLLLRRLINQASSKGESATVPPPPAVVLQGLEDLVMRALAAKDGAPVGMNEIVARTRTTNLRAGEAVERLIARGFVQVQQNVIYGPSFHITRAGRDYLFAQGLA